MKKFLLTATAIAALSAMSTSALAVNLDACSPTGLNTPTFATELVYNASSSSSAVLNAAGGQLTVSHTLGVGIAAGELRWFRYDLTNGQFGAAVVPGDFTDPGLSTLTILQGGQIGDTFVIIARGPAAVNLTAAQSVSLNLNGKVKVTNKANPIGVKVAIYDDASGAVSQQAANRFTASMKGCDLARFASGLDITATPNTTTAQVATEYKTFVDGVGPTLARIGDIKYDTAAGVLNPLSGFGGQVVLPDLVTSASKHVITTTANWLSAPGAGAVFLSNSSTCAPSALAGTAGTTTSPCTVDLPVGDTPYPAASVCYQANGTVPIEAQSFTINFVAVKQAAANAVPSMNRGPLPLGEFKRNGTILKHSFAGVPAGGPSAGFSHTVVLTNTSSSAAPFTVRCLKPVGFDVGVPDTLAAGTARRYGLSVMCAATAAAGQLRGIELTFAVPNGRVFGAMVRENTTTGESSFDTMIGSQIGSL
jgi:hypothetical protein